MDNYIDNYAQTMSSGELAISYAIGAIIAVLGIIAMWKVFQKAGEQGWKAIIPILNAFTLVKIITGNGIKFLLLCIPIVNIIYEIILMIKLAKAFNKSTAFGIGLIFFSPIFMLILAFDGSEYVGPQG